MSGFGLASVYIAPLSKYLIATQGLPYTVLILGAGFLVIVTLLAQAVTVPRLPVAKHPIQPRRLST